MSCQLHNNIGQRLLQTGCIYLSTSICNNLNHVLFLLLYYYIKEKHFLKINLLIATKAIVRASYSLVIAS